MDWESDREAREVTGEFKILFIFDDADDSYARDARRKK
jgi:hypothetical protein